MTAQTTQFTAPGWQYLDAASGYLGGNEHQRQLRHAEVHQRHRLQHDHRDDDATAAQTDPLHGHRRPVHRHRARVGDQRQLAQLRPTTSPSRPDITPVERRPLADRAARLRLHADHHDGQGKGTRQPRQPTLALPYSDNFDDPKPGGAASTCPTCRAPSRSNHALGPVPATASSKCAAEADRVARTKATRSRCSATGAGATTESRWTSVSTDTERCS